MEQIIQEYVDASLDLAKLEQELIEKLSSELNISQHHIKSIQMSNKAVDTKLIQSVCIELTGKNHFKSEDVAKINGLTIITPNQLEITVGEINL